MSRRRLKRDVEVIRVPWDYDYTGMEFDGLFISNGPGDPDTCDAAVQHIRKTMQNEKLPIFGICMGNQLLSKAGRYGTAGGVRRLFRKSPPR